MAQDVELATRKLVTIEKGLEFLVRYLTWPVMEPRKSFPSLRDDPVII